MKEQEEGKKLLFFFPCFPGVAGNFDQVLFLPAWKGNPVTDCDLRMSMQSWILVTVYPI